jgi:RHS repeat-associated protein
MWQTGTNGNGSEWLQSKHIFVGESRIATKSNKEIAGKTEGNLSFEMEHQYWYHSDHLGSAQLTTSRSGELHERIEYTPYGEIWVEHKYDLAEGSLPYRFTGKELDEETGYYYYGARYLDPRTSRWISTDPAVGDYVPSAPVDDEAKKRNGNLPGMGGVFNLVNLHVYHYGGNNPIVLRDPDGKKLKVVDEAYGSSSRNRTPAENRAIIVMDLSIMAGCYININAEGFISMGKINQTGANWDAIRSRFMELLDSDKIVGITTNAEGLFSGGWGFNIIYKNSDEQSKISWANRNGISAYANISHKVNMEYKHNNPKYKGFLSRLFVGERKYIISPQSIGGATAHEVLGHATNYVRGGLDREHMNLSGENLYHKAASEATRDEYR